MFAPYVSFVCLYEGCDFRVNSHIEGSLAFCTLILFLFYMLCLMCSGSSKRYTSSSLSPGVTVLSQNIIKHSLWGFTGIMVSSYIYLRTWLCYVHMLDCCLQ